MSVKVHIDTADRQKGSVHSRTRGLQEMMHGLSNGIGRTLEPIMSYAGVCSAARDIHKGRR